MLSQQRDCLIVRSPCSLWMFVPKVPHIFLCSVGKGCGTYKHENLVASSQSDATYGAPHISGMYGIKAKLNIESSPNSSQPVWPHPFVTLC